MSPWDRNERKDDEFADYGNYLDTPLWPASVKSGEEVKDVSDMAPQHAAAALAKLVRWARHAPTGEMALLPDEDTREDAVRRSTLGTYLVARAANMDPDHFYGLYGEYGSAVDADRRHVLSDVMVSLGDYGLGDWSPRDRMVLADQVLTMLETSFRIVARSS